MASQDKAQLLKGVYNLNPTQMIFKTGSESARGAVTQDVKSFKKVQPPKAKKNVLRKTK